MQVLVDVKELMSALQAQNPNLDLTGVKAYLFDLALGGTPAKASAPAMAPPTRKVVITEPVKPAAEPEVIENDEISEAHLIAQDKFVASESDSLFDEDLEEPSLPKATKSFEMPKPKQSDAKVRRDKKRAEMEDYTNLSSKEIMERIVSQKMGKKRDGQFVDEGFDHVESPGGDSIG